MAFYNFLDIFVLFCSDLLFKGFTIIFLCIFFIKFKTVLFNLNTNLCYYKILTLAGVLYFCFLVLVFLPVNPQLFLLGLSFLFFNFICLPFFTKNKHFVVVILENVWKNFWALYYHPKYISIMQFWEKEYLKRKTTNFKYNKLFYVLETVILLCFSFITALNTRYSFLLFSFFTYYFCQFPFVTPLLFYFIFLILLTLLASFTKFQNYIKKTYYSNVLIDLGWNSPTTFLLASTKKAGQAVFLTTGLYVADEILSPIHNAREAAMQQKNYKLDIARWHENCVIANDSNLPNKPTSPDFDYIRQKRFRHQIPLIEFLPKIK